MLTLAMTAAKVSEDVVALESGPVDTALLWLVRKQVLAALTGFFGAVTWSGSSTFLLPATLMAVAALLVARRRFEALLMAGSMATATLLVYALKSLIGRARPALWETQWSQWYWGSSFPSGHARGTAAFATAAALCLGVFIPLAFSMVFDGRWQRTIS